MDLNPDYETTMINWVERIKSLQKNERREEMLKMRNYITSLISLNMTYNITDEWTNHLFMSQRILDGILFTNTKNNTDGSSTEYLDSADGKRHILSEFLSNKKVKCEM